MSLETILRIGREILPDCVLSGYVDLELGMMLGVGSETPVPQAEIDNLGSAIVSMFDGAPILQIESSFRRATETESNVQPYFSEIMVLEPERICLLLRRHLNENQVICFMCRRTSEPGQLLHEARVLLEEIESELPDPNAPVGFGQANG